MKKLITVLLVLLVLCSCALSVNAETRANVIDMANFFTESEGESLSSRVSQMIADCGFDIVLLTVTNLDGKTVEAYADDFYDYNGYGVGDGRDGILILISTVPDDYGSTRHFSTCGKAVDYFDGYKFDAMQRVFTFYTDEQDYYLAFDGVLDVIEGFVEYENFGEYEPPVNESKPLVIVGAGIVGLVIGVVIVLVMKSKMKTAVRQPEARQYIVDNSLNVVVSYERFLFSKVTKTPKQNSSSSGNGVHISSSGTSHGGRSF